MFELLKKNNDAQDTSSSFDELEHLRKEILIYKNCFNQISDVAQKVAKGDLRARIIHWDEFELQFETLSALNKAFDMADAFIRESGATLEHAAEGKFYRTFVERGMQGDFRRGANVTNSARNHMMKSEESRKQEMIALAD
ncbi:hypothetical protein MNBD_ALPHA03-1775, partial [hydrothermal vent metagenome]